MFTHQKRRHSLYLTYDRSLRTHMCISCTAWRETIASGNSAGSSKSWHKYEQLWRLEVANKFLRQVNNRYQDYPVKVLLLVCGLTPCGSSAPPSPTLLLCLGGMQHRVRSFCIDPAQESISALSIQIQITAPCWLLWRNLTVSHPQTNNNCTFQMEILLQINFFRLSWHLDKKILNHLIKGSV